MDRPGSHPQWRLTSLDFINRPNPIEPQSEPHKHPLNGPPRHPDGVRQDLRRLLVERDVASADGRPAKRRKSGAGHVHEDPGGGSLDLPRLPVRNGAKRMRIPPTLSGLHQPPPDAGLLPSILVEQPPDAVAPGRSAGGDTTTTATATQDLVERTLPKSPPVDPKPGRVKRNRWTDIETAYLLKGVARFNVGNWKKILECHDYHFDHRTALDLRDRFRVCRPQDYADGGDKELSSGSLDIGAAEVQEDDYEDSAKGVKCGRKSMDYLRALGIEEPFAKVKRRKRTKYSTIEDQALLDGFERHGSLWAAILEDGKAKFQPHRTATDLRDRCRTKYPDRYAKIGLVSRTDICPTLPPRIKNSQTQHARDNPSNQTFPAKAANAGPQGEPFVEEPKTTMPEKQQPMSIFPYDDVFFGAPFDDEEPENHRVVLDRGILDWANEPSRTLPSEAGRAGIDPRAILRPPNSFPTTTGGNAMLAQAGGAGEMLPPLAAITADMNDHQGDHQYDQLELPSLMLGGSFDVGDGRAGSHLMNIEDMLG